MGRPPKTPNDELDKFLLRMPDGLRAQLKAEAEQNNRSMNAEIVSRLEFSLRAHPHAYLIRALLDFQQELIVEHKISITNELADRLDTLAERVGQNPNEILNMLLRAALNELDEETEVGKEIAASIRAMQERDAGQHNDEA